MKGGGRDEASLFPPASRPVSCAARSAPSQDGSSAADRLSNVICTSPFISGKAAFGCGQCMPCRFNRRRLWTHRIMLEAQCHEHNSFVMLTYDDANLPQSRSVNPRHTQLFIKRLRRAVAPLTFRYFLVGEYGDATERPHYHAALFGFAPCQASRVVRGDCRCPSCSVVRKAWKFGHVFVGLLSPESASYMAGYTVKKMTSLEDARLNGRRPEFARMSLCPGIGAGAMASVSAAVSRHALDVPVSLRHGSRILPLGRYLRKVIAKELGVEVSKKVEDEKLSVVRSYAWANDLAVSEVWKSQTEPQASRFEKLQKLKGKKL